jgi:tRNA threonylcarbamoyladenosine biosynthesis protein TsaE
MAVTSITASGAVRRSTGPFTGSNRAVDDVNSDVLSVMVGRSFAPPFCYNTHMKHLSKSLNDTAKIAKEFINEIGQSSALTKAMVVALEGDLGSGKTAFTQSVGEILGIKENMHSPTFVIMKIYPISFKNFKNFIHIDAYRLEKKEELLHLGWEEIIKEPESLVFIEWPDRVSEIIPPNAERIHFKFIDETTREISYEKP